MKLNCKKRKLDSYSLTKEEYRLIAALSGNELVSWEKIIEFVYKSRKPKNEKRAIRLVKHRLENKLKENINIITRNKIGLKLNTKIEVM